MLRFLTLVLISCCCALAGYACDMDLQSRSDSLAEYYENGVACLETPPDQSRFDSLMEQVFLKRVNAERRARGLAPLRLREELLPAARFHSLDMLSNAFFAHRSPDGRNAGNRIAAFDRTLLAQSTAENVAQFGPAVCTDQFKNEVSCFKAPGFKFPTPASVVDALHEELMLSDGHRANILAEHSTHVAIGVARKDTAFYVTQVFANEMGELSAPLPVRMRARGKLRIKAKIDGFESTSFSVLNAGDERIELAENRLRALDLGLKRLIVQGQNNIVEWRSGRKYTRTEWLDLFGPAFEIAPSTRS